ncbi:uncharacterized protein LOC124777080 [Schistocerca piceifrons]|uniref:uncharacterized protein LOC124777080 n=1 Tax=Schistocerca piceifrons TaxID=274613 RepID=UPI001F5FAE22|nr:uncharacterized protein LOC124777080 [Schistocerca piceifrons]
MGRPRASLLLAAALCVCAALCSQGWALRCYYCNSKGNASCGDPFSPELANLVNCSRPEQLCGKITHVADRGADVERRCVSGGGSASWASGHVYTCGHDACNGTGRLGPAAVTAAGARAVLSLAVFAAVGRAL